MSRSRPSCDTTPGPQDATAGDGIAEDSPVLAFDLGGTWFRSALWAPDKGVTGFRQQPAMSFVTHPGRSPAELLALLRRHVAEATASYSQQYGALATVGISLGAAIDGNSNLVLSAAPLFGPGEVGVDLGALLTADIGLPCLVLNDVSAGLMDLISQQPPRSHGRSVLVTVSTGIAGRTYDHVTQRIPVLQPGGVQGEIGHLHAVCEIDGQTMHLPCDCGCYDHLSSFSSGRGLLRLAQHVTGIELQSGEFEDMVRRGDPAGLRILAAGVEPLARAAVAWLTIDPDVTEVAIIGGVAERLHPAFERSLHERLASIEMHGVSQRYPGLLTERIRVLPGGSVSPLVGAARVAHQAHARRRTRPGRWSVHEMHSVSYTVKMVPGVLNPVQPDLADAVGRGERDVLAVVDADVARLHGPAVRDYFAANAIGLEVVEVPPGEAAKSMTTVERLVDLFAQRQVLRRSAPVLAIGGGATLDSTSLAASLFRRGVSCVRIPTSLLAMVDASIGVKTGVNFGGGKNRIGTYAAPRSVLVEPGFLTTLPLREWASGLAEIIKLAVISDRELFEMLETEVAGGVEGLTVERAEPLIGKAIDGMLRELGGNLFESNLDRRVDFGHTFSPCFELAVNDLRHGEAVAIDMAMTCLIAASRQLLDAASLARVLRVLSLCRLPWQMPVPVSRLLRALDETAAQRDGKQRVPLPIGLGQAVFVNDISQDEVLRAYQRVVHLSLGQSGLPAASLTASASARDVP